MSRGESLEVLVGLGLAGAGASHYLGWAPVVLVVGGLLIAGAVVPAVWRSAKARRLKR